MACSETLSSIFSGFHAVSVVGFVAFLGFEIYNVVQNQQTPTTILLVLAAFLVLRLPNQVCIALQHGDGWLAVVGTVVLIAAVLFYTLLVARRTARQQRRKHANDRLTMPAATKYETLPIHLRTADDILNAKESRPRA